MQSGTLDVFGRVHVESVKVYMVVIDLVSLNYAW